MKTNLEKSIELGNCHLDLKKRLMGVRSLLSSRYKKYFTSAKFDFENKRLIGSNNYFLQYHASIEGEQQTNRGTVRLYNDHPKLGIVHLG